MVVSRFPYPLEKGDKLRAFHQLKEFHAHFSITLVAICHREIPKEEYAIVATHCDQLVLFRQHWLQKIVQILLAWVNHKPLQVGYFFNRRAHRWIQKFIVEEQIEFAYCQLIRCSEYLKDQHHVIKTLDYQDAFSLGVKRRIENAPFYKKWLFRMEASRLVRYESRMFDFFEHKTMISEQDQQFIMHPDAAEIVCIANGIDPSFFETLPEKKTHDLVFVGNMSYPPNIEAAIYIAEQILPQLPQLNLLISGSSPHSRVKKLLHNTQIELTGWVDDIRTSYARGKVFVAPMMIGTGMQNKLLEAMAMGIPCVTTSLANNAIKGTHNQHILVAETAEEFIDAIQRLLGDAELYEEISNNAREYVRTHFSWETTTNTLVEVIQKRPKGKVNFE